MAKDWKKNRRAKKSKPVVPTTASHVDDVPVTEQELSDAELHFCAEYAYTRHGQDSYIAAFGKYITVNGVRRLRSKSGAAVDASNLLKNPKILEEIKRERTTILRKTRADGQRVIQEIASIAFFDPADVWGDTGDGSHTLLLPHEMAPQARRVIAGQKIKRRREVDDQERAWDIEEIEYKFVSKTDALDKLCKRLGIIAPDAAQDGAEPNVIELPSNNRNPNANDQAAEGAAN